ncbi:ogr/Delta-like zinc finger family protein [Aliivibrio fischeri]|uniref:ogr/Delta-like zinc finger family protein n=1 Tax=Aliivibrio fischeri TaxID=668 RepID=UPI000907F232|nr:ogr/Delta-like zinc finger family protein [Aliivibrio fischeri]
MYVTCPACHSKARTIEQKEETATESVLTCQCCNLNCSSSFKLSLVMVNKGVTSGKKEAA